MRVYHINRKANEAAQKFAKLALSIEEEVIHVEDTFLGVFDSSINILHDWNKKKEKGS